MTEYLTVEKLFNENGKNLQLEIINSKIGFERKINVPKVDRPGLELTGFWKYFKKERMPIFGIKEKTYLDTLSLERIEIIFEKFFQEGIPCAIFAHKIKLPDIVAELANKYKITLFETQMLTSDLIHFLLDYLRWQLAPRLNVHGTLVDVYGVGLLITGRSGIGKSEIALDLIERGHRLISDDSVRIIKRSDNVLIGAGHELLGHHLEIRGIGIINIAKMYGVRGIRKRKRIEVQVELDDWKSGGKYERVGSKEVYKNILGVPVPNIQLPIFPGKNITVICETIALNQMLKTFGNNSAQEFEKMLELQIQQKLKLKKINNYLETDFE